MRTRSFVSRLRKTTGLAWETTPNRKTKAGGCCYTVEHSKSKLEVYPDFLPSSSEAGGLLVYYSVRRNGVEINCAFLHELIEVLRFELGRM